MRIARRWVLLLALVASTIGCDRVTKHVAVAKLSGVPRQPYLADTVRLEYAENPGAFLSLGAGLPPWARAGLLSFGTAMLLVALAVSILRRPHSSPMLVGLCLLWAGGVSNLADRLARGAVVDFLNLGLGPLRTGIFNVADIAVTAGVAVVLVALSRAPRGSPRRRRDRGPEAIAPRGDCRRR